MSSVFMTPLPHTWPTDGGNSTGVGRGISITCSGCAIDPCPAVIPGIGTGIGICRCSKAAAPRLVIRCRRVVALYGLRRRARWRAASLFGLQRPITRPPGRQLRVLRPLRLLLSPLLIAWLPVTVCRLRLHRPGVTAICGRLLWRIAVTRLLLWRIAVTRLLLLRIAITRLLLLLRIPVTRLLLWYVTVARLLWCRRLHGGLLRWPLRRRNLHHDSLARHISALVFGLLFRLIITTTANHHYHQ